MRQEHKLAKKTVKLLHLTESKQIVGIKKITEIENKNYKYF